MASGADECWAQVGRDSVGENVSRDFILELDTNLVRSWEELLELCGEQKGVDPVDDLV